MKKEEFIALGIDEKLAEKAAEESKKELAGFVPKTRFDEVNDAKKQLETSADEYKTQLEELKTSAGDNEQLKTQIAELQSQNQQKEAEYQEQLKEIKLTNAIKLAVAGKAQDDELVAGLFDKSKLILGDDGKVTGLDEQLKTLQESKKFLFKEEKPEQKPPFTKIGGNPPTRDEGGSQHTTLKDAVASYYQQTQI